MQIYLIRHTTPKIEKGICYGFSDLELAASYSQEVDFLSQKIIQNLQKQSLKNTKKEEILIYTSPSQRCFILANDINKTIQNSFENYFQPKIKKDQRLKEMNFGDWELQKWSEINPDQLKTWTGNFVTEFAPNGESFEVLNQRVIAFWQENIVAENQKIKQKTNNQADNKIVFIVSHAGVIRSILCHVLQIPLSKAFSISIDYGSSSKLRLLDTHVQVEFLNG